MAPLGSGEAREHRLPPEIMKNYDDDASDDKWNFYWGAKQTPSASLCRH